MFLVDALKKHLGWCPMKQVPGGCTGIGPEWHASGGIGGGDTASPDMGWWRWYHNQLLFMAILVSVTAAIMLSLFGEVPGHSVLVMGLAIGLGSFLGFLAGCSGKYARVAAGEYVRGRGDRRERIIRYLRTLAFSVPATCGVIIAGVALFALLGLMEPVLSFLLAMSLSSWNLLCITVFWEWRHRMILISDSGSMFTVSKEERGQ